MAKILSVTASAETTVVTASIAAAPGSAGTALSYILPSLSVLIANTSATAGFEYRVNSGPWRYVGRENGQEQAINFAIDKLYFRQTSLDLSTTTAEISITSIPSINTAVEGAVFAAARFAAGPNLNLWVLNGDSRTAQYYAGYQNRRKANQHYLNHANALSRQRVKVDANWATSGQRSDQYCSPANLLNVLKGSAGVYHNGFPGVNNIAQAPAGYVHATTGITVTLANVAEITCADIVAAWIANLAVGRVCIQMLEPGASNFTVAQIAAMYELNQRLVEAAEKIPGVHIFNPCPYLWKNQGSGISTTTLTMRDNYLAIGDPTHFSAVGAAALAAPFSAFLDSIFPSFEVPNGRNINSEKATGGGTVVNSNPLALLPNALFFSTAAGTTSGTGAANVTGTPPQGMNVSCPSAASVTITNAPNAAGDGNDYTFAITYTGAGTVALSFPQVSSPTWKNYYELTDILVAGCIIDVSAGSSNVAPYLRMQLNSDLGTVSREDMEPTAGGNMPTTAYKYYLRTEADSFLPGSTSKGYVDWSLLLPASAAGGITFKLNAQYLDKRFST